MGIPRNALGQPGSLREVVAQLLCQGFQNSHAGYARRTGLPCARRSRDAVVHGVAATESPLEDRPLSRRRPLDIETPELGLLVQELPGMDRRVDAEETSGV